jgi:hypothetical protein
MFVILPASAAAAAGVDRSPWKKPLLAAAVLLALLEQGRTMPTFDRREARDASVALAHRIDPNAAAFWYTVDRVPADVGHLDWMVFRIHVDAMMAGVVAGVPTINGYSGWVPHGWPLEFSSVVITPEDELRVEKQLEEWCRRQGWARSRVQWIRNGR